MHQKLPDSGFHFTASFYDRLAKLVFGNALQGAQKSLFPFIPNSGSILIIGGGSGWVLEQILLTGKQLNILYLEAAPAMLNLAQSKLRNFKQPHNCKIEFKLGTEQALHAEECFDCILTPFLLDLFPDHRLNQLMSRLNQSLVPKGKWLFVDFWPVKSNPPLWQRALINAMYLFFGVIAGVKAKRLPDYAHHFQTLGFTPVFEKYFYNGLIQSRVYTKP